MNGWQANRRTVTLTHGGVLLGKKWSLRSNQIQPKYAAFFNSTSSTTFGYISAAARQGVCPLLCNMMQVLASLGSAYRAVPPLRGLAAVMANRPGAYAPGYCLPPLRGYCLVGTLPEYNSARQPLA